MIGIYNIINKINGKCYIGQSWDIEKRFEQHKKHRIKNHFYSAIEKYGVENFIFGIEYVPDHEVEQDDLNELERFYIGKYRSYDSKFGYNKTFGGYGGRSTEEIRIKIGQIGKGRITSEETKMKISLANKGRRNSMEIKLKMSELKRGVNNPMYGKKHSSESRARISEASSGSNNANYKGGQK